MWLWLNMALDWTVILLWIGCFHLRGLFFLLQSSLFLYSLVLLGWFSKFGLANVWDCFSWFLWCVLCLYGFGFFLNLVCSCSSLVCLDLMFLSMCYGLFWLVGWLGIIRF